MAEIESRGLNQKGATPRQRKKSTRIDMTAMVDVAFLLLTFFILTTTLATPHAMHLTQPENSEVQIAQTKLLSIFLGKEDRILYTIYKPESSVPEANLTDFSTEGIRVAINSHLNRHDHRCPSHSTAGTIRDSQCWDPMFVIKPTKGSKYKNVIDILDELKIADARKYAMAPITPEDSAMMVLHGFE